MRSPPSWREVALGYDEGAAGYDRRHGDLRSRWRFRVIDAPQLRAARGARRVLELGCGTGRLLVQVDAPVRVGIDVSRRMLHEARGLPLHRAVADAHWLPFADACFDAILAGKGVFRYLDYARAFAECARVLAPGGRLAVHQYAARPLSPRRLTRPRDPGDSLHVHRLDELLAPARRAGLAPASTHLFRAVRVPPFVVPVPSWLPGQLWSHCVLVFAKPGHP